METKKTNRVKFKTIEAIGDTPVDLPSKLTDEQLVERHERVRFLLEELDAEAKIIREEFGDRLDAEQIDGKLVGDYNVARRKMIKFPDFPIEKAKELGATKETIDMTMLRKIHKTTPIKGAQEVAYVAITHNKPKDEAA